MKKPVSISLAVVAAALSVGLVAAVAAPILYRDVTFAASAATPSVIPTVTDGSAASIADGLDLAGTWAVASGSTAGYQLTDDDDDEATLAGSTSEVSGSLTVNDQTLTAAQVVVDMGSLSCGDPATDRYLKNTALQTNEYPTATFSLETPIDSTLSAVAGQVQSLTATGKLTLHGVTREVTAALQTSFGPAGAQVTGSIPIDFSDYGVTGPDFGFAVSRPTVSITFALNAVKQ